MSADLAEAFGLIVRTEPSAMSTTTTTKLVDIPDPEEFRVYDEETCAICTENMPNPVVLLPCGHTFCSECVEKWRGQSASCATCRKPVIAVVARDEAMQPRKPATLEPTEWVYRSETLEPDVVHHPDVLKYQRNMARMELLFLKGNFWCASAYDETKVLLQQALHMKPPKPIRW